MFQVTERIMRKEGETDSELRARMEDHNVVIAARNAIWRAYGMKNPDVSVPDLFINGVKVQMATSWTLKSTDTIELKDICVLGKFDVVEMYDKVLKDDE